MAFLSTRAMLVLGVSMAVALHCAAAATYTVGGTTGWTVPSGNTLYTSWASSNTFKVGDSLVFNFATNAHDVRQVNKINYDSCNSTDALHTYATGPATVNLTASGRRYYICSYPGHCSGGQKLAITVSATYPRSSLPLVSLPWSSLPLASLPLSSPTSSPSPLLPPTPSPSPSPLLPPTPSPSPSPFSSPTPSPSAATTSYTVGGSYGWIVPSRNKLYDNWAANKTFKVGDSLVFNFTANAHNVLQVTKTNYDNCSATSPLQTYLTAPATVNLTASGPHYYICGFPGHCLLGQKLAITVSGKLFNRKKKWMSSRFEAAIGVSTAVFITSTIIFIYIRINRRKRELQEEEEEDIRGYMDPLDSRPPSVENFLHAGIPTRYSYGQIKRYTNNFAIRLGQGGFGTVFKEWAFKQVEMGEFRNLRGENIADDEDEAIAKKLSMLGLWCIQYSPSQRPSMSRVIQMLEGTIDIDMPPQPFPIDTSVEIEASTESSSLM
ncbi:hypothetical protein SUGI_0181730 [Cryptomeria japonica]|nr:hypothetical protein SUGI_0181730 [Cryptomeria japonica]